MLNWLRRWLPIKKKPEPVEEEDRYANYIASECFRTGEMVIGNVLPNGDLELNGKVIPKEEVFKE